VGRSREGRYPRLFSNVNLNDRESYLISGFGVGMLQAIAHDAVAHGAGTCFTFITIIESDSHGQNIQNTANCGKMKKVRTDQVR